MDCNITIHYKSFRIEQFIRGEETVFKAVKMNLFRFVFTRVVTCEVTKNWEENSYLCLDRTRDKAERF